MKNLLILLFAVSLFAQKNEQKLSGVLSFDSRMVSMNQPASTQPLVLPNPQKKSVLLAGALSFAVPGAGEFYTENYIKSAAFFAAEVGLVSLGLIYDKKGDDQTQVFEDFANTHWNVQQYAQWTLNKFSDIGVINEQDYTGLITNNQVDWKILNKMESDVSLTEVGKYYSHQLYPYGDQQYYEMIGKYHQFNVGWDDFPGGVNGTFQYGDPVTPRFDKYSGMRGKANDYYNIASTAVKIIVVNHILSTLDAIWSASRYNKAVTAKVSMQKTNIGFVTEVYPELNLKVRF